MELMRLVVGALLAAMAVSVSGADRDMIIATVGGGERPWLVAFPLASNAPARTYSAQRPVTISDAAGPTLLCAGAEDRATVCEQRLGGGVWERHYALDEGREIKGQCFLGRRAAAGATIRVLPVGVEARRPVVIPLALRDKEWVTSVTTDDFGRFEIEHVSPGEYIFEITTKSGRVEESEAIEIPRLEARQPDRPPPPRTFLLPDVRLEEGVNLVVEVRSSDGTPIAKASVEVSQPGRGTARRDFESASDAEGVAKLDGIDGTISGRVSCTARGFTRFDEVFESMPVLVTCGLSRLAKIRGTVVDPQGLPVSQATVDLLGAYRSATTAASGAFTFEAVTPGNYMIRASSSTSGVSVREGTIASGETLDLGEVSLGETRTVRGRVVDAVTGDAIAGASLSVIDPPGASAVTDAEGAFALPCDAKARTRVRVAADGYAAVVKSVLEETPTIRLPRPGSLDVLAWDDETGESCVGCTIVAGHPSGSVSGITTGEGRVRFDALAPGNYQVSRDRVTSTSRGVTVQGGLDSRIVQVRANQTTQVQIGSRFQLVNVSIDPAPAPGFELRAHTSRRVLTADRSRSGMFSFRGHPNETYDLYLATPNNATLIGRVPREHVGQVLSIRPGHGEIRTCVSKNEMPAAGVTVRLLTVAGAPAGWAITDAIGCATIPYLSPGSYSAVAQGRPLGVVALSGRTASLVATID